MLKNIKPFVLELNVIFAWISHQFYAHCLVRLDPKLCHVQANVKFNYCTQSSTFFNTFMCAGGCKSYLIVEGWRPESEPLKTMTGNKFEFRKGCLSANKGIVRGAFIDMLFLTLNHRTWKNLYGPPSEDGDILFLFYLFTSYGAHFTICWRKLNQAV